MPVGKQRTYGRAAAWTLLTVLALLSLALVGYYFENGHALAGWFVAALILALAFVGVRIAFLTVTVQQAESLELDDVGFTFTNPDGSTWGGRWSKGKLSLVGGVFVDTDNSQRFWIARAIPNWSRCYAMLCRETKTVSLLPRVD